MKLGLALVLSLAAWGEAAQSNNGGFKGTPPAVIPVVGAELPGIPSAPVVPGLPAVPDAALAPILPQTQPAAPAGLAPEAPAQTPAVPHPAAHVAAAPQSAVPAAENPAAQLQNLVIETVAPPGGLNLGGFGFDGGGRRRGGKAGSGDEAAPPPEVQTEELRFSRDAKKGLKTSQLYASVRLIKGAGSAWYWGKFKKDTPVRILVGGQTMLVSRVEEGATKTIEELTKKDLAGVYNARTLRERPIRKLRQRLIKELSEHNESMVINQRSTVRVVRFLPYREARKLPVNIEEPALEPRLRKPVALPSSLKNLHNTLPKAVLLDMRLIPGAVPFDFLEDIGKLMKAGVYFVLMTDKKREGPASLEETLTKHLTNKERDQFVRHKLVALTEDGNALGAYRGSFARNLPSPVFADMDSDLMVFEAQRRGAELATRRRNELSFVLPKGTDAKAFAAEFAKGLSLHAVRPDSYHLRLYQAKDRVVMVLRPATLATAIPQLLETLRNEEGLYANMSDLLVISRDPAILGATAGSVQISARAPEAQGEALVDLSLAALLGPYRENLPGDLAASASKITSFQRDKDSVGGAHYNVYMLMGHVMHSSFNWAVWEYRNGRGFPSIEALIAKAQEIWTGEEVGRTTKMIEKPGETMSGYQEAMVARLRTMHREISRLLKAYPLVIGTELPNLFTFERFKSSQFLYRDVLRLIYDLVLARETPAGLEVAIVDFKTGQTPTLQNLEKDTQVRLYDHVVREAWESVPFPYSAGEPMKVGSTKVVFIFPTAIYEPAIHDWNRIDFQKFMRLVMNRMRRHGNILIPDGKPPKQPRKKG